MSARIAFLSVVAALVAAMTLAPVHVTHASVLSISGAYMASEPSNPAPQTSNYAHGVTEEYFDYTIQTGSVSDTASINVYSGGTSGTPVGSVVLNTFSTGDLYTPLNLSLPDGGYCTVLLINGVPTQASDGSTPVAWTVGSGTMPSCPEPADTTSTSTPTSTAIPLATNTPVGGATATPQATATGSPTATFTPIPGASATPTPTNTVVGSASLALDQSQFAAGTPSLIVVSGRNFSPGETVRVSYTAVLVDNSTLPESVQVVADATGSIITGGLTIPATIRPGVYFVTGLGATSGRIASTTFTVTGGATATATNTPVAATATPTGTPTSSFTSTPVETQTAATSPTPTATTSPKRMIITASGALTVGHTTRFVVTVKGTHQHPVKGVTVTVDEDRNTLRNGLIGKTGVHGSAIFGNVKPVHAGTLTIQASKPGYTANSLTVHVGAAPKHMVLHAVASLSTGFRGTLRVVTSGTHGKPTRGVSLTLSGNALTTHKTYRATTNSKGIAVFSGLGKLQRGTLSLFGRKSGYADISLDISVR
jgi:hypothetical protein